MINDEVLDRSVVLERAESMRQWLSGLGLSTRASGALERELSHMIAHDVDNYSNEHPPLAGLSIEQFIEELHRPEGGAVGRVARVGQTALAELRALLPPNGSSAEQEAPAAATSAAPPERRRGRPKGSKNRPRPAEEAPDAALQELPAPVAPEAVAAVAPAAPAPDATLRHLHKLWPDLHPHARRAILLYASTLLAEG